MSTIAEVKTAVEHLNAPERDELFRWLNQREDFQEQRLADLRREIGIGIDEANRGDLAPLDIQAVKQEAQLPIDCWRRLIISADSFRNSQRLAAHEKI